MTRASARSAKQAAIAQSAEQLNSKKKFSEDSDEEQQEEQQQEQPEEKASKRVTRRSTRARSMSQDSTSSSSSKQQVEKKEEKKKKEEEKEDEEDDDDAPEVITSSSNAEEMMRLQQLHEMMSTNKKKTNKKKRKQKQVSAKDSIGTCLPPLHCSPFTALVRHAVLEVWLNIYCVIDMSLFYCYRRRRGRRAGRFCFRRGAAVRGGGRQTAKQRWRAGGRAVDCEPARVLFQRRRGRTAVEENVSRHLKYIHIRLLLLLCPFHSLILHVS
jgi:hypothetical protein